MNLLVVLLLILAFVCLSSSRGKKPPTNPRSTPSAPQKIVVESNQGQPSKPLYTEQFNHRGVSTGYANASQVTASPNLSRGASPDDICNKCGKRWRRWENSENGGYWYSCSGYPSCDNTRQKQIREKFCANGHRRTSSNTAYTAEGHRRCLICRPLPEKSVATYRLPSTSSDSRASRETVKRKVSDLDKFCRNGHRRTTENTYVRPDGERECKICRRNARK